MQGMNGHTLARVFLIALITLGISTPRSVAAAPACVGDCGADGAVTVSELIIMVNIALQRAPIGRCEAGDANGDGAISVNEIVVAVNSALRACPTTGDVIEAEPFDSTKVLGDAELSGLAPETGDGRLVFAVAPPSLSDVMRGDVIVGGKSPSTPHGLLRVVQSVERDGDSLTLTTVNAPIQLAFRRLRLNLATRSTGDLATIFEASGVPARRLSTTGSANGAVTKTVKEQVVLFDGDGDPETEEDQAVLDIELGGTIDYGLSFEFDWGALDALPGAVTDCIEELLDAVISGDSPACSIEDFLPEAKATYDVTAHLIASEDLRGAAKADFEKEFPIFEPATIAEIQLGPVVIAPVLEIKGKVQGGASARFAVGIDFEGDIATGVDISSKNLGQPILRLPDITRVALTPHEPTVTLQAHARADVKASITATLFNTAGPFAELGMFGTLDANVENTPCWSAHAGIESRIGLRVIPSLPLIGAVSLFDWATDPFEAGNLELANGECTPDPNASTLPPGAGPDAAHLANPTFTPWAITVAPPVRVGSRLIPDDSRWTELHPTIDGRYVMAGSHADTLWKLDEAGAATWARQYFTDDGPFPRGHRPCREQRRRGADAADSPVGGLPSWVTEDLADRRADLPYRFHDPRYLLSRRVNVGCGRQRWVLRRRQLRQRRDGMADAL